MLLLKQDTTTIGQVAPGDRFQLPDGSTVSPAYAGWTMGAFSLVAGPDVDPLGPVAADVDAERNRRMRGTFHFNGKDYGCDPESLQRITGAAALAGFFMAGGGSATDIYWHGGPQPFAWIADDNSIEIMDAQTVFAFGQAAAANETAHIFAARALKDMIPIPEDYTSDSYWP